MDRYGQIKIISRDKRRNNHLRELENILTQTPSSLQLRKSYCSRGLLELTQQLSDRFRARNLSLHIFRQGFSLVSLGPLTERCVDSVEVWICFHEILLNSLHPDCLEHSWQRVRAAGLCLRSFSIYLESKHFEERSWVQFDISNQTAAARGVLGSVLPCLHLMESVSAVY